MAGGGVRGGFSHGASDEHGCSVAADEVHVHDFHATILHLLGDCPPCECAQTERVHDFDATILHLLGLDHDRLTYRQAGRNFRLTGVAGRVVREVTA